MSDKVGQSLFEMLYLCIVKRHLGPARSPNYKLSSINY